MLKLHCGASLQHPANAAVIILGNLITVFNILALEPIHKMQAPLLDGDHYKERGVKLNFLLREKCEFCLFVVEKCFKNKLTILFLKFIV